MPASVLHMTLPSGPVIRTAVSAAVSIAAADSVRVSRHCRGFFALTTHPVSRWTRASLLSCDRPLHVTSLAESSSPSIDLTG